MTESVLRLQETLEQLRRERYPDIPPQLLRDVLALESDFVLPEERDLAQTKLLDLLEKYPTE